MRAHKIAANALQTRVTSKGTIGFLFTSIRIFGALGFAGLKSGLVLQMSHRQNRLMHGADAMQNSNFLA